MEKSRIPKEELNKENLQKKHPEVVNYNDAFARIYDRVMSRVPYRFWFEFLKTLLRYHGQEKPERVLELACGTGSMMEHFLEQGSLVTGIDRSEPMLVEAREKLKDYRNRRSLIQADIRDFTVGNNFDLIYSIFDSLNYLLTEEDLFQTFQSARNCLKSGGVFIFDYNTCSRLESIESGYLTFSGDNYHCIWQDIARPAQCSWQVKLSITFEDRPGVFQELHQEKAFPLKTISQLLEQAGFSRVFFYGPARLRRGKESHNRVYFIAGSRELEPGSLSERIGCHFRWSWQVLKQHYLNFR